MKTIINVNQHIIKSNIDKENPDPVLTVKTYKDNKRAHEVEIIGSSKIVYNAHKPLSCGARVWIETYGEVIITK